MPDPLLEITNCGRCDRPTDQLVLINEDGLCAFCATHSDQIPVLIECTLFPGSYKVDIWIPVRNSLAEFASREVTCDMSAFDGSITFYVMIGKHSRHRSYYIKLPPNDDACATALNDFLERAQVWLNS